MIRIAKCAIVVGAITVAGCSPRGVLLHDELIDGPYRLRAVTDESEMHVCHGRRQGACELRIPGRVFAIAHDEDFVVAAVWPVNIQSKKVFYYIVRDFDGPRADVRRAVRGPFDHDGFLREMRNHGVPAPVFVALRR